jgi:hypothetical protein
MDIYEFPSDHIGRKTYVHVDGHSRSIPKPFTYVGTDRRNYLLPEYGGDWSGLGNETAMIMPDISEFRSPVDGSIVSSRPQLAEHNRRHGVEQVGNQFDHAAPKVWGMPPAGHDIVRAMQDRG